MAWFKKRDRGVKAERKRNLPDGLWLRCEYCGAILYKKELERNLWTCDSCGFHFRIRARNYIDILLDQGSFREMDAGIKPLDPLKFKDTKKYADRIKTYQAKTGMNEAILSGSGEIDGRQVSIAVLEFAFGGGSLGSVMGEKIVRAIRRAIKTNSPFLIVNSSGGARMQEGILSLMQMAKVSVMLARLHEAHLPFISILTHPTTGGVSASFAFQGDLILAEPKALIGFAGPRVIQQTIGQELPEGFQRSEFLMDHGQIDRIVNRKELKETVSSLLSYLPSPAPVLGFEEKARALEKS